MVVGSTLVEARGEEERDEELWELGPMGGNNWIVNKIIFKRGNKNKLTHNSDEERAINHLQSPLEFWRGQEGGREHFLPVMIA